MSNLENSDLLIIADNNSADLWMLVGAKGLEYSAETEEKIIEHLSGDVEYKAVLIGEAVYKDQSRILIELNRKEIPWIVVLDTTEDENAGFTELERLSEKAVGMRLSFN